MLGAVGSMVVAALRGGARRGVRAGRLWGSDPGAKGWRGLGGLTEARNRARRPRRGGGVEGEQRGRCGARGRVDAGVLQDSWLHGKLWGRAAKPVEGSGRSESRRRRGISRAEHLLAARAEEGRGPPARADDAGPSAERKRRRHDNVAAAARLCDGARAEMEGGGGRPEECAGEQWRMEEEGNGFIPLAKGNGSKIQPVPM